MSGRAHNIAAPGPPRAMLCRMRPLLPLLLVLALGPEACHVSRSHLVESPPKPKGRLGAVGVTTRTFVDRTRPTPPNPPAPGSPERTLVTEIWYPAVTDRNADEVRDAPRLEGSFPLVLFVHGLTGVRRDATYLTQTLAAAGYVVASADFPLTALDTPGESTDWHVEDQPQDLSFLADQLAAMSTPGDPLTGAVDASAGYAVVGHSTGGTVALLASQAPDRHDERVRAAVVLAGDSCFFADTFFATRPVPLLIVDATRDLLVPTSSNGQRAYALARAPKVHLTLRGGTHLFFTDDEVTDESFDPTPTTTREPLALTLAKYGGGNACEPIPPPADDPPLAFDAQHDLTASAVTAFLDAAVRQAPADLNALRSRPDPRVAWEADGVSP